MSNLLLPFFLSIRLIGETPASISYYKLRPADAEAVYFTPENFNITPDGKSDVTDALQEAINKLKMEQNFGIIFIPEGTYKISRTIYVPAAIRIIGYGNTRPLFVLIPCV